MLTCPFYFVHLHAYTDTQTHVGTDEHIHKHARTLIQEHAHKRMYELTKTTREYDCFLYQLMIEQF